MNEDYREAPATPGKMTRAELVEWATREERERVLRLLRREETGAVLRGDAARVEYTAELAQRLEREEHWR